MRKCMLYLACLIAVVGLMTVMIGRTNGSVLTVGSGKTYSKIQDAVNDASSGDHIEVYDGTYAETVGPQTTKSLTIRANWDGENYDDVDVTGNGNPNQDEGFIINNHQGRIDIKGIEIRNCRIGISASFSNNIHVDDCNIHTNIEDGIKLNGVDKYWIDENWIWDNGAYGIKLIGRTGAGDGEQDIQDNWISENVEEGVLLCECHGADLWRNVINDNGAEGVYIYGASRDIIIDYCDIVGNIAYGVLISAGQSNIIIEDSNLRGNNGGNQNQQIWDACPTTLRRNHYSDYTSPDANNDGIVDTPYTAPPNGGTDSSPMVNAYVISPSRAGPPS